MSTSTLAPAPPDPAQVEREVRMLLERTPDKKVTREVIEAALWRFTGWRGDTAMIEAFLRLVDAYAKQPTPTAYVPTSPDLSLAQAAQREVLTHSQPPADLTREEAIEDVIEVAKDDTRQPGDGKPCNNCGEFKPWTEFTTDNARKDGKRGKCKTCEREAKRLRRNLPLGA